MAYQAITDMNQTNANTLLDVFNAVATGSNNIFGALILITIFLGYYFLFSKEQTIQDLLASSFITMIVASLFLFIDLITWPIYAAGLSLMLVIFMLTWWMS